MARRLEKVLAAQGAFAPGHKFWGNQWSAHAQDPANDPAGEPSGRIRHAVLVIGGKRYRGPSHFQALQQFQAETGGDYPKEGLNAEGFETESGHFLDRNQSAKYVQPDALNKWGKKRFEQLPQEKRWLAAQDINLQSVDGALYTRDRVLGAAFTPSAALAPANGTVDTGLVAKVMVFDAGGRVLLLHDSSVDRWDLPGGHLKDGEGAEDGARREVAEETGLNLDSGALSAAGSRVAKYASGDKAVLTFEAHLPSHRPAVALSPEHDDYRWVAAKEADGYGLAAFAGFVPTVAVGHAALRDEAQAGLLEALSGIEAQAEAKRGKRDFNGWLGAALWTALAVAYLKASERADGLARGEQGEPAGGEEVEAHVRSRLPLLDGFRKDLKQGPLAEGRVEKLAEEEAHAAYGNVQDRAIRRAGYATKFWVTVGDEKVCEVCGGNEARGQVSAGGKFPSGHVAPPAHMFCRCWLEAGSKGEPAKAKDWDESKHPRGQPENKGEFGSGDGGAKVPDASLEFVERVKEKYPEVFGGKLTPGRHIHKSRDHGDVEMRDATEEERKKLAIPPKYGVAKVPVELGGPLLWKALAPNGKVQLRRSPTQAGKQLQAKHQRGEQFCKELPELKARWEKEISEKGPHLHEALALRLIHFTGFRNGGEGGGGKKPAYGATSLRAEHVAVEGDKMTFEFPGKGGHAQKHELEDAVLADFIRSRKAAGSAKVFDTDDDKLRKYLHSIDGDFIVHDFRTHVATRTAAAEVARLTAGGPPKSEKEAKAVQKAALELAAKKIGDTVGVAKSTYVNPLVFAKLDFLK